MSILEKGAKSDLLRFLYVPLWVHKSLKTPSLDIFELRKSWSKIWSIDLYKDNLPPDFSYQFDNLAENIRGWQGKIASDLGIKCLRQLSSRPSRISHQNRASKVDLFKKLSPLLSISARSKLGLQIEIWFPKLSKDYLDANNATLAAMGFWK